MGLIADLRRVTSARARPRIPAAGRAANAHPPPTDVGLLRFRLGIISGDNNIVVIDDDAAPATPDARARASYIARALALGATKRVKLLVAATVEEPRPDAVSPDREGDGAVVEVIRR